MSIQEQPSAANGQQVQQGKAKMNPVEAHLYAQKLNNSAAFCIEIGECDRAIVSLRKALNISLAMHNQQNDTAGAQEEMTCFCSHCTIEGCISYSESIPANLLARTTRTQSPDRSKKRRRLSPPSSRADHSLFKRYPWRHEEVDPQQSQSPSSGGCSIYYRPIQVTPQSICQCHNIGSKLSLLIIFNLALAHHKCALSSSQEDERLSFLQKTLKFYELAESCYARHKNRRRIQEIVDQQEEPQASDRFEMILWNNASHVYRSLDQHAKCEECLERLTSALMLVVDHKLSTEQQHEEIHPQEQEDLLDHNNCDDDKDRTTEPKDRLEGFFQTAAQQILQRQCADAA